jgi:hypothetical protein
VKIKRAKKGIGLLLNTGLAHKEMNVRTLLEIPSTLFGVTFEFFFKMLKYSQLPIITNNR